jgi:hypothetical protein
VPRLSKVETKQLCRCFVCYRLSDQPHFFTGDDVACASAHDSIGTVAREYKLWLYDTNTMVHCSSTGSRKRFNYCSTKLVRRRLLEQWRRNAKSRAASPGESMIECGRVTKVCKHFQRCGRCRFIALPLPLTTATFPWIFDSLILRKSRCVSYVVCIELLSLVNTSWNFKITCGWKMAYKRDTLNNNRLVCKGCH